MIISRATVFYGTLDVAHNVEHGERVAFWAAKINEGEHADPFLVEAGAWLHQYHDHLDELRGLLWELRVPREDADRLLEMVRDCRPHKISISSSLEARIVFDADALELMGPYGIVREVLSNVAARGMSWDDALSSAREVQRLFEETLMTATAKTMAKRAIKAAHDFWDLYDQWRALDIE